MKDKKLSWDKAAVAWTTFVRDGKDFFRDCLNNPAAFELIGDLKNKEVLDLACGEGFNTRLLASKGACVTAIDNSKTLLTFAQQEEHKKPLGIKYSLKEASHLEGIASRTFDLVTCFMALMDIEDYEAAIEEVARVLKPEGRFVFSIVHPCFEKMTFEGVTVEARDRYFEKLQERVDWTMDRLTKKFVTTAYHRTLSDYSSALAKSRLLISRIIEPQATNEMVKKHPVLHEELKRPISIIFETIKKLE